MSKIYNTEVNEICEFANRITPKNWKVLPKGGLKQRLKDHFLYITLHIGGNALPDNPDEQEELMLGLCEPIRFFYRGDARWATIGFSLWLFYDVIEWCENSWERVIIHELAHIVINRRLTNFKDTHGPTFQKAYLSMINRAEAVFGSEIKDALDEARWELDYFKSVSDE